jgi:hypothetical protein
MDRAAIKESTIIILKLAESGNKSFIVWRYEGRGFTEALEPSIEESECKRPMATVVNFNQSLLSPRFLQCIKRLKKGKDCFCLVLFMVASSLLTMQV